MSYPNLFTIALWLCIPLTQIAAAPPERTSRKRRTETTAQKTKQRPKNNHGYMLLGGGGAVVAFGVLWWFMSDKKGNQDPNRLPLNNQDDITNNNDIKANEQSGNEDDHDIKANNKSNTQNNNNINEGRNGGGGTAINNDDHDNDPSDTQNNNDDDSKGNININNGRNGGGGTVININNGGGGTAIKKGVQQNVVHFPCLDESGITNFMEKMQMSLLRNTYQSAYDYINNISKGLKVLEKDIEAISKDINLINAFNEFLKNNGDKNDFTHYKDHQVAPLRKDFNTFLQRDNEGVDIQRLIDSYNGDEKVQKYEIDNIVKKIQKDENKGDHEQGGALSSFKYRLQYDTFTMDRFKSTIKADKRVESLEALMDGKVLENMKAEYDSTYDSLTKLVAYETHLRSNKAPLKGMYSNIEVNDLKLIQSNLESARDIIGDLSDYLEKYKKNNKQLNGIPIFSLEKYKAQFNNLLNRAKKNYKDAVDKIG